MDCRTFQKQLEDYLEGGLDFAGRFGMERHAQQCFCCGKQIVEAQKLGRMARDLMRVSAPANFEASLLRRISAQEAHSRCWSIQKYWIYGFEWPAWSRLALVSLILTTAGVGIYYSAFWVSRDQSIAPPLVVNEPGNSLPLQERTGILSVPAASDAANAVETSAMEVALPKTSMPVIPLSSQMPDFTAGDNWKMEPADSEYVEYMVPGPGDSQMIVRLPKTIRLNYGQYSEENFIRNVSH
jgi:hypothetical protein